MGKILHVDLSHSKTWEEKLREDLILKFLGSRGINARLLWDYINEPHMNPFDERNPLIISAGVLTGTTAPSSGRTTITCKGVITGLYLKSSLGGRFGAELKYSGYDCLIIHGISPKLVSINIRDEEVTIDDASQLRGLNVKETSEKVKKNIGDEKAQVLAIGPAGERLVKFAGIVDSEVYNTAARGGTGALMGSKRLKAISIRGTHSISLFDKDEFIRLTAKIRRELAKDSKSQALYLLGTSNAIQKTNEIYRLPTRNFSKGHVDQIEPLTGSNLISKGYLVKRIGCHSCSIMCHRRVKIPSGKFAGLETSGPEYETFAALGSQLMVLDTDYVIKANDLCNIYGIDTISTGDAIAWAMELYERGILKEQDVEGLDIKFGNGDAVLELIERIAFRRGKLGNLLAEGLKRATEEIGYDSIKYAGINSKGLEQSEVNVRIAKGYALAFAVNTRGPDHLMAEPMAESGGTPEAQALVEKITGNRKWAVPYRIEYRPELIRWHEDVYAVTDSLGFCAYATTAAYGVTPSNMAEMYYLATGIQMTEDKLMEIGRRIVTLEKCFNVREGADRRYDDLPWRAMNEPEPEGPFKGMMTTKEQLDLMLDRYYELHEWDKKTSWPYKRTLKKLGLEDIGKELEEIRELT